MVASKNVECLSGCVRLNSNKQKNNRIKFQLLENGGECQNILTRDEESCPGLKIVSEPSSNL